MIRSHTVVQAHKEGIRETVSEEGDAAVVFVTVWVRTQSGRCSESPEFRPCSMEQLGGKRNVLALIENLGGSAVGIHLMRQSPDSDFPLFSTHRDTHLKKKKSEPLSVTMNSTTMKQRNQAK